MNARSFRLFAPPVALTIALCGVASAQQLDLPRPSPNARVSQFLGLTEVTVDYSSPGVKGRAVWGTVVPYDQLWRTGANAATKVTFSKDVVVGDKPVAAGSYSIFTIPGKTTWTVVLNRNATASTREYKQSDDVLRLTVTPKTMAPRERLAFVFSDFDDSGGNLDIEWEKVRVSIPIKVATEAQTMANIKALVDNSWRPYNAAARYLLEAKKNPEMAMQLVDRSLSLKEDWLNLWTKAQLLAAKGDKKAAHGYAEKAKALGDKSENFFFKDEVAKALTEWKK
jgi:hypothetical protein